MIYTSTKPKKTKKKYASADHKRKEMEAQAYQEQLYKQWGIIKSKSKSKTLNKEYVMKTSYRGKENTVSSVEFTGGACTKKQDKKYTGTLVVGISQTHKSNAVPVINQQEIIDIRHMRR